MIIPIGHKIINKVHINAMGLEKISSIIDGSILMPNKGITIQQIILPQRFKTSCPERVFLDDFMRRYLQFSI